MCRPWQQALAVGASGAAVLSRSTVGSAAHHTPKAVGRVWILGVAAGGGGSRGAAREPTAVLSRRSRAAALFEHSAPAGPGEKLWMMPMDLQMCCSPLMRKGKICCA
ncbi:hypothetical protein Taro_026351 [Colocasia esculenta]|uniref:Uncharacterized protein n=1 Tax=Colocasia esculenta TaxID=4460 RepID=A0A843VBN9_COLES|nr:hypothetical protein [Colocasia esculenta]